MSYSCAYCGAEVDRYGAEVKTGRKECPDHPNRAKQEPGKRVRRDMTHKAVKG